MCIKTARNKGCRTICGLFTFVALSVFIGSADASQSVYVPVRAVLQTGAAVRSNTVRLPAEGGSLGLFLDASVGEIARYEIDLNTSRDSDGDGITDNDVDNNFHSSLFSGRTFPVSLRPGAGETGRELKLTVTGADGKTSEAKVFVIFGAVADEGEVEVGLAPVAAPSVPAPSDIPALPATPAMPATQEVPKNEIKLVPNDAGTGKRVRIDMIIKGLTVMFQPVVPDGWDISAIEPTWTFGDGKTSYLFAPEHTYETGGTYAVALDVKEIRTGESIASENVKVVVKGEIVADSGGAGLAGAFGFVMKVALFVLIILVLVAACAFVFFVLKSKREGVPLGEITTGYKKKFSGESDEGTAGKAPAPVAAPAQVVDVEHADKPQTPDPPPLEVISSSPELPETPGHAASSESPETPKPPTIPESSEVPKPLETNEHREDTRSLETSTTPETSESPEASDSLKIPESPKISESSSVPAWLDKGIKEVSEEEKQNIIKGDTSKIVESAEPSPAPPTKSENESADVSQVENDDAGEEPVAFIKADNVTETEAKDGVSPDGNTERKQPDDSDVKPDAKKEEN